MTFLPLDAMGTYERTVNVAVPNNSCFHPDVIGNRYLLFGTDASASQGEANEQNNLFLFWSQSWLLIF